ncbi:hypothetical protein [Kitasatospora sp. SUK 42]|uniref:hypothetical protein n=1 Tax=Kitasatospora sp. SUK 42 TaxID=1588882 RepID=UPI0018CAFEB4|nr:hypothetical protein [Kitasatospora sp. SUK 42]MBV2154396.1 hypothetical protein [Kitasatospora sp. SUK 42]
MNSFGPARPRVPWTADLLLSLVTLVATPVVTSIGLAVGTTLAALTHAWTASFVTCLAGVLVLLVLTAWGTWRSGYRIAPCLLLALPVLMPLGLWLAIRLHLVLGR